MNSLSRHTCNIPTHPSLKTQKKMKAMNLILRLVKMEEGFPIPYVLRF